MAKSILSWVKFYVSCSDSSCKGCLHHIKLPYLWNVFWYLPQIQSKNTVIKNCEKSPVNHFYLHFICHYYWYFFWTKTFYSPWSFDWRRWTNASIKYGTFTTCSFSSDLYFRQIGPDIASILQLSILLISTIVFCLVMPLTHQEKKSSIQAVSKVRNFISFRAR